MTNRNDFSDPLPGKWLPDSPVVPPEDDAYWERRLDALMTEADPKLASYRRVPVVRRSWLETLAVGWRPAAAGAFALAASVILALALGAGGAPAPGPQAVVLSAIVNEGTPASLWQGAGIEADPILALLALEGDSDGEGGNP
jgi:hypothetical protein